MVAKKRNTSGVYLWIGFLVCIVTMFVVIRDLVKTARDSALGEACYDRLRVISQAAALYVEENDGRLPLAETWMDALKPYVDQVPNRLDRDSEPIDCFRCPGVARTGNQDEFGYAFMDSMSGVALTGIPKPSSQPLIIDSADLRWNSHGTLRLLPEPRRHFGNVVISGDLFVRFGSKSLK